MLVDRPATRASWPWRVLRWATGVVGLGLGILAVQQLLLADPAGAESPDATGLTGGVVGAVEQVAAPVPGAEVVAGQPQSHQEPAPAPEPLAAAVAPLAPVAEPLAPTLEAAAPILEPVVQAVSPAVNAAAPVVEAAAPALEPLAEAVSPVVDAAAPLVEAVVGDPRPSWPSSVAECPGWASPAAVWCVTGRRGCAASSTRPGAFPADSTF